MNVSRKISSCIFFLGLFCGVVGVPIAIYGLPATIRLVHALINPAAASPKIADALPVIALTGLLIGFATAAFFLLYIIRRIVLPIREAAAFADQLAGGEMPPAMRQRSGNDEIATLIAALNFLRDRQRNLTGRYQMSLSREAEIRREIERHDRLQLRLLTRMVPEIRLPLGVIKGYAQIARLDAGENPELNDSIEQIIRQVGRISRQIERMIDVGQLGWDRWNQLEITTFDSAGFVRELMSVNVLSLRAREVTLVNHFSASVPSTLTWDRELLFQLLTIMIRAVGRVGAPGEAVVFSCFQERHSVVFEVRDSRHGECREDLVALYREAQERAAGGAPLEERASVNVLALCFAGDIAEKAGGRFSIDSTAEAQIRLRFELGEKDCCATGGRSRQEQEELHPLRPSWDEAAIAARALPSNGSLNVLLGDDLSFGERILTRLLGEDGIHVTGTNTLEELERQLKNGAAVDAVILSLTLCGNDPVPAIRSLREVSGRPELPVVVVGALLPPVLIRQLNEMERVYALTIPLNYALLARLLYAGRSGGER